MPIKSPPQVEQIDEQVPEARPSKQEAVTKALFVMDDRVSSPHRLPEA